MANFAKPKMLVTCTDGRTILEWSLRGLLRLPIISNWVFVVREEHIDRFGIDDICKKLVSPSQCKIVEVDFDTRGQLHTVLLGRHYVPQSNRLVVHNCDTFFRLGQSGEASIMQGNGCSGEIVWFSAADHGYSYLEMDHLMRVSRVVEKPPRPNGFACTGTSIFRSAQEFFMYADQALEQHEHRDGELYLSTIYRNMIDDGHNFVGVPADVCYPIGKPEELDSFNEFLSHTLAHDRTQL